MHFTGTFDPNRIFHWFYFPEIHSESLPSHRFQIVGQFVHFDIDLWFEGQISKCFCRKSRTGRLSMAGIFWGPFLLP